MGNRLSRKTTEKLKRVLSITFAPSFSFLMMPALTRARQSEAIQKAHGQVVAFIESLEEGTPVEVASALLRPAETALEELLGVISTDEILDRVFREFCIGK